MFSALNFDTRKETILRLLPFLILMRLRKSLIIRGKLNGRCKFT